jgi:hypothetical protein
LTSNQDEPGVFGLQSFTEPLNILKTISPKPAIRHFLWAFPQQEKGTAMPIGLRVIVILACAYAGWQTAGVHSGKLPELQQRTNITAPNLSRR